MGWNRGQDHRGKADKVRSHAAPPHHPASTRHTHKRSPQPQRLPNSKLDFIAQDLADLWTQTVRGNQGEAVLGRAGLLIPAKPPGMPRDPPGYLCLAKRSSRLGR